MYEKKIIEKSYQKFITRFKNVTFEFSFAMVYIIHKMLVLPKNYLNYLKDSLFEWLFKEYNKLLFLFQKNFFSQYIMM